MSENQDTFAGMEVPFGDVPLIEVELAEYPDAEILTIPRHPGVAVRFSDIVAILIENAEVRIHVRSSDRPFRVAFPDLTGNEAINRARRVWADATQRWLNQQQ
jgi:hypothetical protein